MLRFKSSLTKLIYTALSDLSVTSQYALAFPSDARRALSSSLPNLRWLSKSAASKRDCAGKTSRRFTLPARSGHDTFSKQKGATVVPSPQSYGDDLFPSNSCKAASGASGGLGGQSLSTISLKPSNASTCASQGRRPSGFCPIPFSSLTAQTISLMRFV